MQSRVPQWIGGVGLESLFSPLALGLNRLNYISLIKLKAGFLQVRENWKSHGKGQGKILFLEKSGKMKNWCHQMSDFQAKMHQV